METIQIDDEVFRELAQRAVGFNITPNDVLRRILNLKTPLASQGHATVGELQKAPLSRSIGVSLAEFMRSDLFKRHHQSVDRFLIILGWLHSKHAHKFEEVILNFQRGKRIYFAKSEKEIIQSGEGVTAKPIPESIFWALTTLDNKSKRIVIEDVLKALKYSREEVNSALSELPDSGIRRSHGRGIILES